ncbi:protein FAM3A isoform X2 [Lissotriton helveticus]
MRLAGSLRIVVIALCVGLTWILASVMLGNQGAFPRIQKLLTRPENSPAPDAKPKRHKCGLPQACPDQHFSFRVVSGAANVIGPKLCFEDRMVMSSVQNNVGRGLNVVLINDVNDLLKFIRPLYDGTLIMVASYDDAATKMNEEARKIFMDLGSTAAKELAFRDSWVFLGAKGIEDKSPFELHMKNSKATNKYEGWPEALELEGCVPARTNETL